MTEHWSQGAPRSLLDPLDPRGAPLPTPLDRRWLWRVEQRLSQYGTGQLGDLARDLGQYLRETCEHHWLDYTDCCDPPGDGCLPPHRLCLWCQTFEWSEEVR